MAKEPNFSGAALVVALVDDQGNKVSTANPLQTALNASVTLEGDLEIGGVYLLGDVSGNKAEVTSGNSLKVDGSSVTQPVSVASLPLPSGAATSTKQDTAQTSLSAIAASVASSDTRLAGPLAVTGTFYQATQPVSGTFWQATQPISGSISFTAPQHVIVDSSSSIAVTGPLTDTQLRASAVPVSLAALPAFTATPTFNIGTIGTAASAANQATEIASLANLDVALSTRLKAADTLAAVTTVGTITNPVAVTGTFYQATQPVSAASLPLPSGAAIESGGNLALIAAAMAVQIAQARAVGIIQLQALTAQLAGPAGFVPVETPAFLFGG